MKEKERKKTWVKSITFKNPFLNYFLRGRFYPDVKFYGSKKNEKELSNRYNSPRVVS